MGAGDIGSSSDALSPPPTRGASPTPDTAPAKNGNSLPVPSNGGDLLDLEAIFGGGAAAAAPAGTGAADNGTTGAAAAASGGVDLLAEVFGASGGLAPSKVGGQAAPPAVAAPVAAPVPVAQEDDFGGFEVAPSREEKVVVSDAEMCRGFEPRRTRSIALFGCVRSGWGWATKSSAVLREADLDTV